MSTVCTKYVPWAKQKENQRNLQERTAAFVHDPEIQRELSEHKEVLQKSSFRYSLNEPEKMTTMTREEFSDPADKILDQMSKTTDDPYGALETIERQAKDQMSRMAHDLRGVHYTFGTDEVKKTSSQRESFGGHTGKQLVNQKQNIIKIGSGISLTTPSNWFFNSKERENHNTEMITSTYRVNYGEDAGKKPTHYNGDKAYTINPKQFVDTSREERAAIKKDMRRQHFDIGHQPPDFLTTVQKEYGPKKASNKRDFDVDLLSRNVSIVYGTVPESESKDLIKSSYQQTFSQKKSKPFDKMSIEEQVDHQMKLRKEAHQKMQELELRERSQKTSVVFGSDTEPLVSETKNEFKPIKFM